jgi:hypothetical protein
MGEAECYTTVHLMLHEKDPNRQYFTPTKKGITLFLHTFDDLIKEHVPKIFAHIQSNLLAL